MSKSRIIMAAVALALIISLAGCAKVWTVDFARVEDISDWNDDGQGTKELVAGKGLNIDGWGTIGSPVAFDADFEESVKFKLKASAGNYLNLVFYFCDTLNFDPDNYFFLSLVNVGEAGKEGFQIMDSTKSIGTQVASGANIDLPYIDRDGDNTFLMKKTGNVIGMYLNGKLLYEFALTYCQGAKYYVRFRGETWGSAVLTFKSIKVSYKGSMI